jgi:hypothetical protein
LRIEQTGYDSRDYSCHWHGFSNKRERFGNEREPGFGLGKAGDKIVCPTNGQDIDLTRPFAGQMPLSPESRLKAAAG